VTPQGYPAVNFDAQHSDGSGTNNLNIVVRSDAHTALSREIAAASAVLLKNTAGTPGLPLSTAAIKRVAIIGKDALIPNLDCGDLNECDDGTMEIGSVRYLVAPPEYDANVCRWGSGSNSLDFTVPPITALNQTFVGTGAVVTTSLSNDETAGAKAAHGQDVAIVLVNAYVLRSTYIFLFC
jgi:beta-glucosidase